MREQKPGTPNRHSRPRRDIAATELRIVSGALRARPDLLRSTALQAVFLAAIALPAGHAAAQTLPAATALPTGGKVIAGQATIGSATSANAASMTVNQATKYGAYDWKTFDVGKNAAVTYQVPTSQSISVNRVISPTSPSVIAGKLSSNGVLVVQNQSGVVFTQGAEVNVSTLIASAPGISDANARAGRLVFDQPANPGARVENHGTITVAQTGLAALVAPQVANSGVIRAQMGRVVLAGAEAHTVDLYGDGLLSIDVTKQVTQAPVGRDGKTATALVTNSGTIIADGGTILLTASAVEGLVQNLVTAGGTVRADTAGGTAGRVVITAAGGNVAVTGTVAARGQSPGSKGGRIEINAPARSVTLKAGATVDASGRAGGGTVAVGTTLARAKGGPGTMAPTASNVVIESGVRVAADATQTGQGGDITVLSQGGVTEHRGELSARGGPDGGNGGFIEVSGSHFVIGGRIDTGAPNGTAGSILLDPDDLDIKDSGSAKINDKNTFTANGGKNVTVISPADIRDNMTGAVTLQTGAGGALTVSSKLDVTLKDSKNKATGITSLTLLSDGDLKVNAAITGGDNITLKNTAGNLTIGAAVTTADGKTITLDSAGGITLQNTVSTGVTGIIDLKATSGGVSQTGGSLVTGTLQSPGGIAGDVTLTSATNSIAALGVFGVTKGNVLLVNKASLDVTKAVTLDPGTTVSFAVPGFTISTGSVATTGGTFELAPAAAGAMSLGKSSGGSELVFDQASLGKITAGTITLGAASAGGAIATAVTLRDDLDTTASASTRLVAGTGGIVLTKGTLKAGALDLTTAGGGVTDSALGTLAATSLQSSGGVTGTVGLTTSVHTVGSLGALTVTKGALALATTGALAVTGAVKADSITLASAAAASAKAIEVGGTGSLTTKAGGTIALLTAATSGITLSGVVNASASGILDLTAGSLGVLQDGAAITTGTLRSSSGIDGTVKLAQAANAVGTVGDLAVANGDFILTSGTAVAVTGALSAANVTITDSAAAGKAIGVSGSVTANGATGVVVLAASDAKGGIALSGAVTASKGSIDLSAGSGGVVQSTGSLTTQHLVSSAGIAGTASLASASNAIDATGGIKVSGGDLLLATATALDVQGALAVDATRTLSLGVTGLKLSTGSLVATGGTVQIAPLTAAAMSLGKAAAAELTVTGADLAKISSATLRLGSGAASAAVADSVFVRDNFDASTAATTRLGLDAGANGITIDSGVTLKANTLDLNTTGSGVNAIAGSLVEATRLQSTAGITGDVALANDVQAIGTLGDIAVTTGMLGLRTSLALDVAGAVSATSISLRSEAVAGMAISVKGSLTTSAGGTVTLAGGDATKGGIALSGPVDASATGTLDISAGADGVVQSAGSIVAGTLLSGGVSAGTVQLTQATNAIAAIGDLAVGGGGGLDVTSTSTIAVTGKVSASNATLVSTAAANGAITVSGALALGSGGTASLTANNPAGGIRLSGTVDTSSTGLLSLRAGSAGVDQTGGLVIAQLVQAPYTGVEGKISLGQAGNKIAQLGGKTDDNTVHAQGDITVASTLPLMVGGEVTTTVGGISLLTTAATLDIAGALTSGANATIQLRANSAAGAIVLGADVTAGKTGTIDLSAGTGGVVQSSGSLTAATLRSSFGSAGTVKLGSATNLLGSLSGVTVSAGDLILVNAAALSLAGTVAAPTGTIDLSTSAGGISSSGIITAARLQSSQGIAGGLNATGNNAIATVGDITATGGNIVIGNKTGTTLTIAGAVAVDPGQTIRLEADASTITTGSLTATGGTVELRAPTADISLGKANGSDLTVLQTDLDNIATSQLNLTSSAGSITLRADLDATTAAASRLRLDANKGVALTAGTLGAPTLELAIAANGATQTAGVLAATTLVSGGAGVTGAVSLGNTANTIAAVGDLAATGTVTLASAALMNVTGTIKATGIALSGGAAGAALAVDKTGTLALSAPGTIALTTSNAAGTTALAGSVNATATGTLQLAGAGTVSQTGGQIVAGTLTAPAAIGGADLSQATNAITTLGAFTATGDLALTTVKAIAAGATVSTANTTLRSSAASATAVNVTSAQFDVAAGGTITLAASDAAGGIALSGTLNAGVLDLSAGSAGVAQSGGSVTAATLRSTGGIGGALNMAQANTIAALGALAANGAITLTTGSSLAVTAPVSAGDGTTLSLTATGMSFSGTGALTATGGTVEIGPGNATASFALGSAAGDFALGDLTNVTADLVRIGQASSTGNANTAASIALAGAVAPAATTLELISAGAITQTSGGLVIPVLTAKADSLDVNKTGNTIGALGPIAVAGDFALASDSALSVGGTLSAANITLRSFAATAAALDISGVLGTTAGGAITLAAANATGGIALSGKLDATATGIADLSAGSGGIKQSAGSITAGTLRSASGSKGAAQFDQASNAIGALGNFAVSGAGLLLRDSLALDITGAVSGTSITIRSTAANTALTVSGSLATAGAAVLVATDSTGGIALSGTVNAGVLDLSAGTGGIAQSAGSLVATTLQSSSGSAGTVALGETTNSIAAIGNFAVKGADFTLIDSAALTVSGKLSAATVTLRDSAAAAKAIDLTGSIAAAGGGSVTLAAINGAAGISLSGALDASTSGIADVSAGSAGITQTAGTITAGTLRSTGGASGAVALTQSGNSISKLGNFVVTGASFALTDSLALTVSGAVQAVGLTLTGTAAGPAITVPGSLSAGTGTLALVASDTTGGLSLGGTLGGGVVDLTTGSSGIAQTGGAITATTLRVTVAGGNANLSQAANSIAVLGDSTITGGGLALVDSAALTVSGAVSANAITLTDSATGSAISVDGSLATTAGGTITLVASNAAGALALSGALDATQTGIVDLSAGTDVIQGGGSIKAGTLRSTDGIGGTLTLDQAGNAIGQIATLAVVDAASVVNSIDLTIAGPFSASDLSVRSSAASATAIALTGSAAATGTMTLVASDAAGGIALSGTVKAATLDLSAGTGGINQSAGAITVGTLTGKSGNGSSVFLTQSGNTVSKLADFAVPGGTFQLIEGVALAVTGSISSGGVSIQSGAAGAGALDVSGAIASSSGDVTLAAFNATGGMALSGTVAAAGNLTLTAGSGGISQTGGSVSGANLLGGVTGGDMSLTSKSNAIGTVFSVAVIGGAFTLVNGGALGVAQLSADSVSVRTLAGAISTSFTGIVSNASGSIVLDATGGIALGGPLNAGVGIVDLTVVGGGISQTAKGAITAGTLRSGGGVVGNMALATAGNSIATLGDFAVTGGTFVLGDTAALTVAGVVSAANITLIDDTAGAGALTVNGTLRSAPGGLIALAATGGTGGITLAGTVDATATGLIDIAAGSAGVAQTAGTITAATLQSTNGIAGATTLTQAGNAIAALGAMKLSAGDLNLTDSLALTVTGPLNVASGNLSLTSSAASAAALNLTGPVNAAGTATLVASDPSGGITLASTLTASTLDLAAGSGGVSQTGGAVTVTTLQNSGLNGPVSLPQAANSIATIGAFTVGTGNIVLVNAIPLTVAGTLVAAQGAVNVTDLAGSPNAINVTGIVGSGAGNALSLAAPSGAISIADKSQVSAPGGLLTLASANGITGGGTLTAGKLSVATSKAANIALTGANAITTLADATVASGTFSLNNTIPLSITGPVTARLLGITATGALKLADGVAITTDGLSRVAQKIDTKLSDAQIAALTTAQLGSFLSVKSSGGAPGKIDIGNITVAPFSASQATIDFVLPQPEAGTITIGQLVGKSTDLILVTRQTGVATGTVDVGGLLVLGGGGKADLFGTIDGLQGQAAANKAGILALPSADYRFNACPITSINCVLLPVQTVPPLSPLRDVPNIRDRPSQDDVDVQLPNVSDEDY